MKFSHNPIQLLIKQSRQSRTFLFHSFKIVFTKKLNSAGRRIIHFALNELRKFESFDVQVWGAAELKGFHQMLKTWRKLLVLYKCDGSLTLRNLVVLGKAKDSFWLENLHRHLWTSCTTYNIIVSYERSVFRKEHIANA